MELLDKDGKNLEQFLADYDPGNWERPSLTTDVIVFSIDANNKPVLLLIKRKGHPFIGQWAFPGGFVNYGESSEDAARRELEEETGVSGLKLEQMYTVSTPDRDPRTWIVTVCYIAVMDKPNLNLKAGDDAAELDWFIIDYIRDGENYSLKLTGKNDVLSAQLKVKRDKMGGIDINATEILNSDKIAFDHAKLILQAIERL